MALKSQLARGVKAMLFGRIVHVAANGLLLLLLTRYLLGPDGYGMLTLTLSILTFYQLVSDLGLGKSAAKYITEYRETEPGQVLHVLLKALKIRTLTITVAGVAALLSSQLVVEVLDEPELLPLLYVGVIYLVCNSYRGFNGNLFQGFNRVSWTALLQITNSVGRVVFAVVFVVGVGMGVLGAFLGYVAGAALSALVGFVILYTKFYPEYDASDEADDGLTRRIVEYSAPLTITRSAGVINGRVDSILIGYFLTPGAVGLYALGKQISSFSLVPAGSLGFAVSPTYGEQKANEEMNHAGRLYEQTLEYTLLLYVPAAVGLVLVAEPTTRLIFGTDYLGSVVVIQIFAVYIVLQALVQITTDGLDFLGRARMRAVAKGATSFANLLLNVVLIPPFGIAGAAIATVITTSIYAALNLYIMHEEMTLRGRYLLETTATIAVIAGAMGAVVFLAKPYITGLVTLFGVIGLGVLVWAALSVTVGPLDLQLLYGFLREQDPDAQPDVSD